MISAKTAWSRAHVSFGFALLFWAVLYSSTLQSMVHVWWDTGTYHYAFLIFPIVIWLVWNQRHTVSTKTLGTAYWGVFTIAVAGILWLLGALVSVNVVQHFSVIAMLPCLVLVCYGSEIAKTLIFPLGYLFFAVPYGNFLVGPMRTLTARISVRLLQLSGSIVFLNGHLIEVPTGSFEVADACSGIKFFIATTALGTLYAHLFYQSWRRRLIFIVAALIIPIVANGLRVYFTILIGQTFGMHYAEGTDHLIFGWQFFGTVLLLLFLVGWHWRQDPPLKKSIVAPSVKAISRQRIISVAVMTTAAMIFAPAIVFATAPGPVPVAKGKIWDAKSLVSVGGLVPISSNSDPIGSQFENGDAYLRATYRQGNIPVSIYIAQYLGIPQHGHEVLDFSNRIYAHNWRVSSDRRFFCNGHPIAQLILQDGSRKWLVWYWYQVHGRAVTDPIVVKLLQLMSRLEGKTSRAAVIRMATPTTDGGEKAATQVLTEFYNQQYLNIIKLLGRSA